jgi:hypothetical protein
MQTKMMPVLRLLLAGLVIWVGGCESWPSATPEGLQSNPNALRIVLQSIPNGAKVFELNGNTPGAQIGVTPITLTYQQTGGFQVYGSRPEQTLDIAWFDSWRVKPGTLSFRCVLIADGFEPYQINELLDKSEDPGVFKILRTGVTKTYTIPLKASSSAIGTVNQTQTQQQTVIINQGSQQEAKTGSVLVDADVEDAEIYVDGYFIGNAPTTLRLSEGLHVIEVRKQGKMSIRREVKVAPGSEVIFKAKFLQ